MLRGNCDGCGRALVRPCLSTSPRVFISLFFLFALFSSLLHARDMSCLQFFFHTTEFTTAVAASLQAGGVDYHSGCGELRRAVHCGNGVRLVSTDGHG
jgi:hypothetical protein